VAAIPRQQKRHRLRGRNRDVQGISGSLRRQRPGLKQILAKSKASAVVSSTNMGRSTKSRS